MGFLCVERMDDGLGGGGRFVCVCKEQGWIDGGGGFGGWIDCELIAGEEGRGVRCELLRCLFMDK